jgi:hypothetical protein
MSPDEQEFEVIAGRLLGSPDGKWVLNELERRFAKTLFSTDPLTMAYNVGQFEMIDYMRSFISEN